MKANGLCFTTTTSGSETERFPTPRSEAVSRRGIAAFLPHIQQMIGESQALLGLPGSLDQVQPRLGLRGRQVVEGGLPRSGEGLQSGQSQSFELEREAEGRRVLRIQIALPQVSPALALWTGAGVLLHTLDSLMNLPLGFESGHLVTARVSLPDPQE